MLNFELIKGDCLSVMDELISKNVKIDMILCDPPYDTTQNKWDSIIDLKELWNRYDKLVKVNGAICIFGQGSFSAKVIMNNEKQYRYTLIWEKTRAGGFLNANRMPLQAHEDILVFYKKLPTYNPQMEDGKPYVRNYISECDCKNYNKFYRKGTTLINNGKRYPRTVIKFANDNHKSLHPTQKPVDLCEWLIRTYTNEHEIVLDNCMGSGTVGIACKNTNRRFIGIEKDCDYFNIAKNRIGEL